MSKVVVLIAAAVASCGINDRKDSELRNGLGCKFVKINNLATSPSFQQIPLGTEFRGPSEGIFTCRVKNGILSQCQAMVSSLSEYASSFDGVQVKTTSITEQSDKCISFMVRFEFE